MKILSIIVTFNGIRWYDYCFNSLLHSKDFTDVFVIDNCSSDNSVEYIRKNFPKIKLIESKVNLGFGQANNKGIQFALENNYDYVLLLNQDAWIYESDTISKLIRASESSTDYGIICPIQLYGNGLSVTRATRANLLQNDSKDDLISQLLLNQPLKNIYPIEYANAAAWLIPVKTIKMIGGFDPIFFHYGEDDNYLHRLKFHGLKLGICPQAFVCHDIESRSEDYGKQYNNKQKNIIVELCNINNQPVFTRFVIYYLKASILKFLKLKFDSSRSNYKLALFIFRNRIKIIKSRAANVKTGTNWL